MGKFRYHADLFRPTVFTGKLSMVVIAGRESVIQFEIRNATGLGKV
jgi:hypothetical protein